MCEYRDVGILIFLKKSSTSLSSVLCNVFFISPETGGITIAPRPSPDDSSPKPGFPSLPFFGILPELRTENVSNNSVCVCVQPGVSLCVF